MWIEYDLGWANPACDTNFSGFVKDLADKLHNMHVAKYSGISQKKYQIGDLGYIM